jgi:UDP-4-amino-4,6-dideoxy-N-acetyl-beta-L-altrosamine transaminase
MIPYGRQEITLADIESVIDVLRSDFLTQGPAVPKFEASVTTHVNVTHAVAVNSATSALHIACLALGLGVGDILWTTPITFVASANCALYCGASVDFVDIDPKTYNISIQALEEKLVDAERNGKLPKIVVAVHLCGQPCEMDEIYRLSKLYGFKIIEDASHAIGGKYKGEFIGNCRYSDITVFSFHPVKIITTAEGGMALTNSDYLAEKMQLLRSHGITRDSNKMTHEADGPWYYQQVELGYNYRMTDIQAALGVSQMTRLDQYVATRHSLVDRYNQELENFPLTRPWQHSDSYSAFHLYVIRLNSQNIHKSHLDVFNDLRSSNIGVNLHYIPVHTQPYYQKLGFKQGDFPEAEKYYSEAISLPLYATLSTEDQNTVIHTLKSALA